MVSLVDHFNGDISFVTLQLHTYIAKIFDYIQERIVVALSNLTYKNTRKYIIIMRLYLASKDVWTTKGKKLINSLALTKWLRFLTISKAAEE